MHDPLISIIIPVLNGSKFLERCFSTLEKQTYSNLEIIFIDNGSSDDTKVKIESYYNKKKGIKLLNCSKISPGAARNVGIKNANGEYISFLDVDDEIVPEKHRLLVDALEQNPNVGMVFGNTVKKYTDGREYKIDLSKLTIGLNYPPECGYLWIKQFQHQPHISAIMIPKKVIEKVNFFPEDISFGEDIALTVKIGIEFPVLHIIDTLSFYYRHEESSISMVNTQITASERYFQFYENFALPYFYNKINQKSFNKAFYLSERIAFNLLMKIIKLEKNKKYKKRIDELIKKRLLNNYKIRSFLFLSFPYYIARTLNQKLYKY